LDGCFGPTGVPNNSVPGHRRTLIHCQGKGLGSQSIEHKTHRSRDPGRHFTHVRGVCLDGRLVAERGRAAPHISPAKGVVKIKSRHANVAEPFVGIGATNILRI